MSDETLFPEPRIVFDNFDSKTAAYLASLEQQVREQPERYLPFASFVIDAANRVEQDPYEALPVSIDDHQARHTVETLIGVGRELVFDEDTEDRLFEDDIHRQRVKELQAARGDSIEQKRDVVFKSRLEFFLRSLVSWQELYPADQADIVPIVKPDDDSKLRSAG